VEPLARKMMRVGNWELAAIQVITPAASTLWVEPHPGLNVVYGRNGVGKSLLLEALKHLLSLDASSDERSKFEQTRPLARAYLRLQGPLWYEQAMGAAFLAAIEDSMAWEGSSPTDQWWAREWRGVPSRQEEHGELRTVLAEPPEYSRIVGALLREISQQAGGVAGDGPVRPAPDPLQGQVTGRISDNAYIDRSEHLRGLIHSYRWLSLVAKGLAETVRRRLSFYNSDPSVESIASDLSRFGFAATHLSMSGPVRALLDELPLGSLLEIYCWDLLRRLERGLHQPLSGSPLEWLFDFETGLSDDTLILDVIPGGDSLLSTAARALAVVVHEPVFWMEREAADSWSIGLAMESSSRIDSNDPRHALHATLHRLSSNQELSPAVSELLSECGFVEMGDPYAEEVYPDSRVFRFNFPEPKGGYLPIAPRMPLCSVSVPLVWALDLDQQVDVDRVSSDLLAFLVDPFEGGIGGIADGDSAVLLSDFASGMIDLPRLPVVSSLFGDMSELIRRIGLDISDIDFKVTSDIRAWACGKAAFLQFQTTTSPRPLPFEQMSSAQRYWVSAVMRIALARGFVPPLILGDEPDSGIHERAAHSAFRFLSEQRGSVLVSSHSVSALRQPACNLLHLCRDGSGIIHLERPGLGGEVTIAAERLGTTPFDLLAFKRAMVVVEGSHDAEIIRRLVACSQDELLAERLIVAPMRGVKNVVSAADSVLLTDFTDLHVVVVVDNASAAVISRAASRLIDLLSGGTSVETAFNQSGFGDLAQRGTPEERVVTDLALRLAHRGLQHRFHICPLPTADVIELLPESAFELTRSWADLRAEFQERLPSRQEDFKDWLRREYGARISTARIGRAFDALDEMPQPLRALLEEIEIVGALSVLDR